MGVEEKDIQVRRMVDEDIPLVKVIDRSLSASQRAISWPVHAELEVEVYRPALSFIAELNGVAVGFLLGDIRGVEYGTDMIGWIDMLAVHPKYQRLGIGRRLVEAFCEACARNKVNAQVLLRDDDEQLKRFFNLLDFHRGGFTVLVREPPTEK